MKAILIGGLFNGKRVTIEDDQEEIKIVRYRPIPPEYPDHPYIRPCLKATYTYTRGKTLNLGQPVAYFKEKRDVAQIGNIASLQNELLSQQAAKRLIKQRYDGPIGIKGFGGPIGF